MKYPNYAEYLLQSISQILEDIDVQISKYPVK